MSIKLYAYNFPPTDPRSYMWRSMLWDETLQEYVYPDHGSDFVYKGTPCVWTDHDLTRVFFTIGQEVSGGDTGPWPPDWTGPGYLLKDGGVYRIDATTGELSASMSSWITPVTVIGAVSVGLIVAGLARR